MIYSEADKDADYLKAADTCICIGPASPGQSYLNAPAILLAMELTGAGAVHPGYGFLSERASFSEAVEAAGAVFIGPRADAIRTMGDKIAAKRAMMEAGVPCRSLENRRRNRLSRHRQGGRRRRRARHACRARSLRPAGCRSRHA
jgi:acetyl-CoA carboxylase, biotin carboxylase subunit